MRSTHFKLLSIFLAISLKAASAFASYECQVSNPTLSNWRQKLEIQENPLSAQTLSTDGGPDIASTVIGPSFLCGGITDVSQFCQVTDKSTATQIGFHVECVDNSQSYDLDAWIGSFDFSFDKNTGMGQAECDGSGQSMNYELEDCRSAGLRF